MKCRLYPVLLVPALLLFAATSWAAGEATLDEAKSMALKAAEYLRAVGPEKALSEFNAKDGPWHDRDLYVFVMDADGVTAANGNNTSLVGRNVLDLKDPDGKSFIRAFLAINDEGWVDYRWQNPVTKKLEAKTSYEVRVGGYVVGVGAYAK